MLHLPLVHLLLRIPPLVHLLWIHPPSVWPLESLVLIYLQISATTAGLLWRSNPTRLSAWRQLEGDALLRLVDRVALGLLALPPGGVLSALTSLIAACLIPNAGHETVMISTALLDRRLDLLRFEPPELVGRFHDLAIDEASGLTEASGAGFGPTTTPATQRTSMRSTSRVSRSA